MYYDMDATQNRKHNFCSYNTADQVLPDGYVVSRFHRFGTTT